MGLMLNSVRQLKFRIYISIIACLVFGIAGCAPKQVPVNFDEINVDDILEQAKINQQGLESLRGVARVKAKSSFDDLVINQVTLLQLPLKFRLEALAAFGQSLAVLTSDGEQVVFRTSNDQVVFPDVRNFNLSNFYPGIPREIKSAQLIDLLMGKIPFGLWSEEYATELDKEKGKILVDFTNSNNSNTLLTVDPSSANIERAEIVLDGSNILTIDYANFTNFDRFVFPKAIYLNYQSYELSIKYGELNLNDKIDDSLFFQ